jgi:hypothetical protein
MKKKASREERLNLLTQKTQKTFFKNVELIKMRSSVCFRHMNVFNILPFLWIRGFFYSELCLFFDI